MGNLEGDHVAAPSKEFNNCHLVREDPQVAAFSWPGSMHRCVYLYTAFDIYVQKYLLSMTRCFQIIVYLLSVTRNAGLTCSNSESAQCVLCIKRFYWDLMHHKAD
jgi:hypothetical protein